MKRFAALVLCLLLVCVPLAGCSEKTGQELVDAFTESLAYDPNEGKLSFTVPADTPTNGVWTIMVSGRLRMGEDFMSWHGFEDIDSWESGRTYIEEVAADAVDTLNVEAALTTPEGAQYGVSVELYADGTMMALGRTEQ